MLAYEHDGLFLHVKQARMRELRDALDDGLDGYKCTLEPQLSVEVALEEARREMVDSGGHGNDVSRLSRSVDRKASATRSLKTESFAPSKEKLASSPSTRFRESTYRVVIVLFLLRKKLRPVDLWEAVESLICRTRSG